MLLRESQRPPLPVGDLLDFADCLTKQSQSHLGKAGLLLDEADLTVVGLGVDESLDVAHEHKVRVLPRELLDVG